MVDHLPSRYIEGRYSSMEKQAQQKTTLLQGVLDMLVLRTLLYRGGQLRCDGGKSERGVLISIGSWNPIWSWRRKNSGSEAFRKKTPAMRRSASSAIRRSSATKRAMFGDGRTSSACGRTLILHFGKSATINASRRSASSP